MVTPSGTVDFDQESDKYFRRLVLFNGFDQKVFQSGIFRVSAGTYSDEVFPDLRLWRSSPFRLITPKSYQSPTKCTLLHPAGFLAISFLLYDSCGSPNRCVLEEAAVLGSLLCLEQG